MSFQTVVIHPADFILSIPLWLLSYVPLIHLGVKLWVFIFLKTPLAVLNFLSDSIEFLMLLHQMGWIESIFYLLIHSNNLTNKVMGYLSNSNRRLLIRLVLWPVKTPFLFFIIKPAQFLIQFSISAFEYRLQESNNKNKYLDEGNLPLQPRALASPAESSKKGHGVCKERSIHSVTKEFEMEKQKIQSEMEKAKGKGKEIMTIEKDEGDDLPSPRSPSSSSSLSVLYSSVSSPSTSGEDSFKSSRKDSSTSSNISLVQSTSSSNHITSSEGSGKSENLKEALEEVNTSLKVWDSVSKAKNESQIEDAELLTPVEEEKIKTDPTPLEAIEKSDPLFPPAPMFHSGFFPEAGENSVVLYTTSNPAQKHEAEASKHAIYLLKKFNLDLEIRDCFKRRSLEYDLNKLLGSNAVPQLFEKGKYWGNVNQITKMHCSGELNKLLEGVLNLPTPDWACGVCEGESYVGCPSCKGTGVLYIEGEEDDEGDECIGCSGDGVVCCEECFNRRN